MGRESQKVFDPFLPFERRVEAQAAYVGSPSKQPSATTRLSLKLRQSHRARTGSLDQFKTSLRTRSARFLSNSVDIRPSHRLNSAVKSSPVIAPITCHISGQHVDERPGRLLDILTSVASLWPSTVSQGNFDISASIWGNTWSTRQVSRMEFTHGGMSSADFHVWPDSRNLFLGGSGASKARFSWRPRMVIDRMPLLKGGCKGSEGGRGAASSRRFPVGALVVVVSVQPMFA